MYSDPLRSGRPELEPRLGPGFPDPSTPAPRPIQPPAQRVVCVFFFAGE